MPLAAPTTVAAVVLAGGRSRRFGSDKLEVTVHGRPLVSGALEAAAELCSEVVLVGPPDRVVPAGVLVVREEPVHSGPYAAVACGLAQVRADVVLVLAGDLVAPLPLARLLLDELRADAALSVDVAVAVDAAGRRQPLLAAYRVEVLRERLHGIDPVGRAAMGLLDGARVLEVPDHHGSTRDVDTREDLDREG